MTDIGEIARRIASFDEWCNQHDIVLARSQQAAAGDLILALLPLRLRASGKTFLLETVDAFFDDVMRA